jgi:hypothetical protein
MVKRLYAIRLENLHRIVMTSLQFTVSKSIKNYMSLLTENSTSFSVLNWGHNGSLRPHAIATLNSVGRPKSPLQATAAKHQLHIATRQLHACCASADLPHPTSLQYRPSDSLLLSKMKIPAHPPTESVMNKV